MDKLWPITTRTADDGGGFWLGSYAASALADEFGTPVYVFDEATLRTQAGTYREALALPLPRHGPGCVRLQGLPLHRRRPAFHRGRSRPRRGFRRRALCRASGRLPA